MSVFLTKIPRASHAVFLAALLSGTASIFARNKPVARAVEGMLHTEWLVLPAGTAADLLRKARFNRLDAGSLRDEVLRLIKAGQGRIAAQDALRLRSGYQEWSAGTLKQWPGTYTGPRMAKDITVNDREETTDPVEPALVHTTTQVFTGRRSNIEYSFNGDGSLYAQLLLEWLTPQGSITWGQGSGAKTFPVTHEMAVRLHGPQSPGHWSFAGMVTPPVAEENLEERTGSIFARSSTEGMLVFVKMELDPVPDAPAVPALPGDGESPGCLVEWVSMEDTDSAALLDRFPSFADPALHSAIAELTRQGKAELMETFWVAGASSVSQLAASQTTYPIPCRYELVTPWRIQRTTEALLPLGPVRKPWWLTPAAMGFERTETGMRVVLQGNTSMTTDGMRLVGTLDLNGQQLTGMMVLGLPGLEIAAPIWQRDNASLDFTLVPGQPTVVRTFEAPAEPSAKPWPGAPASRRKCWLILTAAKGG